MKQSFVANEKQRFSIRKYSFGVTSILLGMSFVCASQVSADEGLTPSSDTTDNYHLIRDSSVITSSPEFMSSSVVDQSLETPQMMTSSEIVPALSSKDISEMSMEATSEEPSLATAHSEVLSKHTDENTEVAPRMVSNSTSLVASKTMIKENETPELPKQGTYIYPERTEIRNEAKLSAPVQFYVNAGDKVFYDNLVTKDGHHWLTYLSYSGVRRYAPLGKVRDILPNSNSNREQDSQKVPQTLATSGTYRFTEEVAVKNAPKAAAKTEFTFNKGESINYDKTLIADNFQWLSYVSYSGTRRYVALSKVKTAPESPKTNPKPAPTKNTSPKEEAKHISQSGTYTFTQDSAIKNKPELSARTEFVYRKGDKVNYDRTLENDGHHWLSYISYSGTRRYVDLGKVKLSDLKEENKPAQEVKPTSSVKLYGRLDIKDISNEGFTITVSEVSSPTSIKAIKVPVWSDQGGQDDLVWYTAQKQVDDTYQVKVASKTHKRSTGDYHVHLYYDYGQGQLKGILSTKVTLPSNAVLKPAAPSTPQQKLTFNGSYYSVAGKYEEVLVVNKKYPLSAQYNPGENPTAKAAFVKLRNDMIAKGYNVGYGYSGFRSYNTQAGLYQSYVNRDGQAAADRYSARPGYSEHQTGLAFDLTDKSGRLLEDKAASVWVQNHAHEYGFVVRYQPGKEAITGFMQEAWHLRYVGKEAREIHDSGLSLEEYYGFQGGDYGNIQPKTGTNTNKTTLPAQGTYTFSKGAFVKADPKPSNPELAYYKAGSSVHYDKVVNVAGHQWLSYMSYSGVRRYVAID
ncbi:LD-carboxypeptidase LdcB/DacB [Streptococcus halotolerans]|uniref:LD-carboxypeptidase LdcB/DacB n=1 Tax=Streptococcus halotolerans TaxID=1814128 RepID=UPI000788FF27|nr:LD-carboxypeptidase LdcB/DacB [Streptococcus halotolerans]